MKHKHYDLIVAKAENMDLVVFTKTCVEGAWFESANQLNNQWWEDSDYFLCLPKHEEACLHWLNGGGLIANAVSSEFNSSDHDWGLSFRANHPMMQRDWNFRVAPKKEKRWIGVFKDGDHLRNTEFSYKTKEQVMGDSHAPNGFDHWQFIEIEVEV